MGEPEGFVPIWVTIAKFLLKLCPRCEGDGGWKEPISAYLSGTVWVPCPDCKDLRELTAEAVAPTATRPAALVETKGEGE